MKIQIFRLIRSGLPVTGVKCTLLLNFSLHGCTFALSDCDNSLWSTRNESQEFPGRCRTRSHWNSQAAALANPIRSRATASIRLMRIHSAVYDVT